MPWLPDSATTGMLDPQMYTQLNLLTFSTASLKKAYSVSSLLRKKSILDDAWEYEGLPQGADSQVFLRR